MDDRHRMEIIQRGYLFLPLVKLTWDIILVDKKKNRKQSGGGYYHQIQHKIRIFYFLCVEGGI